MHWTKQNSHIKIIRLMKLHYVFPNNISFNRSNGFTERTLFDVNCCLPTKNHSTCFYSKTSILIQPLRLSVMVLTQFEICSFKIIYTMHRCKLPKPTKIGYLDTQSSKRKFCASLKRIKLMVILFTVYYCNVANMKSTLWELRPWKSFSPHSLNAR